MTETFNTVGSKESCPTGYAMNGQNDDSSERSQLGKRTSILLADDHSVVRRGLRMLLQTRSDFNICGEANDGRQAVELARQHSPDIVVLDIAMPLLNGIDATRQIRASSPGTEVLVFSQYDSEDTVREAIAAGARGYVLKSDIDDQIINAIDALSRHRTFFSHPISDMLFDKLLQGDALNNLASILTSREREIVQLIARAEATRKSHERWISASRRS